MICDSSDFNSDKITTIWDDSRNNEATSNLRDSGVTSLIFNSPSWKFRRCISSLVSYFNKLITIRFASSCSDCTAGYPWDVNEERRLFAGSLEFRRRRGYEGVCHTVGSRTECVWTRITCQLEARIPRLGVATGASFLSWKIRIKGLFNVTFKVNFAVGTSC